MDTTSIATTAMAEHASQVQYAVAAFAFRTNADEAAAVAGLVDAAAANAQKLSALPAGVGGTLDVTA